MPEQPLSLEDAFRVSEQASPLPQVAHEAMRTLVPHVRRWRFWVDAITEDSQRLLSFLRALPFPTDKAGWDAAIDQAIENSGWSLGADEAPTHYEDFKHGIHGFDAGIEVGGAVHGGRLPTRNED